MMEEDKTDWVQQAATRSFDILAEMAPGGEVGEEDIFYFFVLIALGVTKDVDAGLDIFIEMAERINRNRIEFYNALITFGEGGPLA
jgi:hypothetical protein